MTNPKAQKQSRPADQFFETDNLQHDLKQRSVRGGVATILAQASKFVLQMGSTVILARLLLPEDYGLVGMVTVVIGFASLFKDLGLSSATVQKADINHQQVSALFWINLVISCLIAGVVVAIAPLVALFYQEPRLTDITIALASIFILGGLTVQHQALLQRRMQFTQLSVITIVSALLGIIAAIMTANFGYWALVIQQIVTAVVNAVGVWVACAWRPGRPGRRADVGAMLAFGSNLTGFNLVNYFSRNLDNILIGRFWGSQQLGYYAKAYQLVLLPIQQINVPVTSVALPTLSRLQHDPIQFCRYYYKALLSISAIGMPLVCFLFASAPNAILLVLGERWLAVVPIFRLLMPAAFNATVGVGMGWATQSLGMVNRLFRWGVVSSLVNVGLFVIGVRWGALGVAAAYGLSRPFFLVAGFAYCLRETPLSLMQLARTLLIPTAAALGAAAVVMLGHTFWPANWHVAIALVRDLVLYGVTYMSIWLVTPGGKATLKEVLLPLKSVLERKTKPFNPLD